MAIVITVVLAATPNIWKIDFNPTKSAAIIFQKGTVLLRKTLFPLDGFEIPQTQNVEYLGLPIGNKKWKKVERNSSFYALGCTPKSACPNLVSFLYSMSQKKKQIKGKPEKNPQKIPKNNYYCYLTEKNMAQKL
ncbi:hypothetical protein BpHYR1_028259 [Brachionus plicatilis]|uniref:Uncharacterized protein n=1 Tax=Brachionus plicatilis TaxID=10195 RepID=A0A3M7P449_BRAPC|nr:hypothetical protein BpHYR1_028259 [Brachionus plicatilis]